MDKRGKRGVKKKAEGGRRMRDTDGEEMREREREQKLSHQERGKEREGRLEEVEYPLP